MQIGIFLVMRLNNGKTLYFADNHLNSQAFGQFRNSPFLYYNGIAYTCEIAFVKNELIISDLIRCKSGTTRIAEHLFKNTENQIYHRQYVSWFQKQRILLNMNIHLFSYKKANARKIISIRKRTIFSFLLAISVAVLYLLINLTTDNKLMSIIRDNVYVQSSLIFLSIVGIMRLWRPFSIKKGIGKKDIEEIAQQVFDRNKEEGGIDEISHL